MWRPKKAGETGEGRRQQQQTHSNRRLTYKPKVERERLHKGVFVDQPAPEHAKLGLRQRLHAVGVFVCLLCLATALLLVAAARRRRRRRSAQLMPGRMRQTS